MNGTSYQRPSILNTCPWLPMANTIEPEVLEVRDESDFEKTFGHFHCWIVHLEFSFVLAKRVWALSQRAFVESDE